MIDKQIGKMKRNLYFDNFSSLMFSLTTLVLQISNFYANLMCIKKRIIYVSYRFSQQNVWLLFNF